MKVTSKYLANWINSQLPEMNVEVILKGIRAINKNAHPAMGFTYRLLFEFEIGKRPVFVYSYYNMKEMSKAINNGYEIYWKMREGRYLSESIIDVKKIENTPSLPGIAVSVKAKQGANKTKK